MCQAVGLSSALVCRQAEDCTLSDEVHGCGVLVQIIYALQERSFEDGPWFQKRLASRTVVLPQLRVHGSSWSPFSAARKALAPDCTMGPANRTTHFAYCG